MVFQSREAGGQYEQILSREDGPTVRFSVPQERFGLNEQLRREAPQPGTFDLHALSGAEAAPLYFLIKNLLAALFVFLLGVGAWIKKHPFLALGLFACAGGIVLAGFGVFASVPFLASLGANTALIGFVGGMVLSMLFDKK